MTSFPEVPFTVTPDDSAAAAMSPLKTPLRELPIEVTPSARSSSRMEIVAMFSALVRPADHEFPAADTIRDQAGCAYDTSRLPVIR